MKSQKQPQGSSPKPSSQQNYRQLYEQAKQTISLQEAKIIKLQNQIRQRCQSYLLHSGIRSANSSVNSLGSSRLRSTPSGMPNNSSSNKKQREMKLNRQVFDQTIVAILGVSNSITRQKTQDSKTETSLIPAQDNIINICTNLDLESEAITALKDRLSKIRAEKNEIYKQFIESKEENKKLNEQINKLENLGKGQDRSSKKSNQVLQEQAEKFQRAFRMIESEIINREGDEDNKDEQAYDPIQKMAQYIQKIKSRYGNERSLFNYSDTIQYQLPSQGEMKQDSSPIQFKPTRSIIKINTDSQPILPSLSSSIQSSSPNIKMGFSENITSSIKKIRQKQNQQPTHDSKEDQEPFSANKISLEAVKQNLFHVHQQDISSIKKSYEKQLTQLKIELSRVQDQSKYQKEELDKASEEVKVFQQKIKDYQYQMRHLKKQADSKKKLQQDCDKLNDQVMNLIIELTAAQKKNQQIVLQLQRKAEDQKLLQTNYTDINKEYSSRKEHLKQILEVGQSNLTEQLRLLQCSQERLSNKNIELEKEVLDLTGRIKNMEEKQAALGKQIYNLKKEAQTSEDNSLNGQIESKRAAFGAKESNFQTFQQLANKSLVTNAWSVGYDRILSQNNEIEKQINELRECLANQQSSHNSNHIVYNSQFEPFLVEEDIKDDVNGQSNYQFVKRRFVKHKLIRRNISVITFRPVSHNRKEAIEILQRKVKQLKQRGMLTGNSSQNGQSEYNQTQIKKYVSKMAELARRLKSEQDGISEFSIQSSYGIRNNLKSDSSFDQQNGIDLVQLTTEIPGKNTYAANILQTQKTSKEDQIANQPNNYLSFVKKGKVQSSEKL